MSVGFNSLINALGVIFIHCLIILLQIFLKYSHSPDQAKEHVFHRELGYFLATQAISCRAICLVSWLPDVGEDRTDHPAMLKSGDFFRITRLNPNRFEFETIDYLFCNFILVQF